MEPIPNDSSNEVPVVSTIVAESGTNAVNTESPESPESPEGPTSASNHVDSKSSTDMETDSSSLSIEDLSRLVFIKQNENKILLGELERVRQLYSTVCPLSLFKNRVDSAVLQSKSSPLLFIRSPKYRNCWKNGTNNSTRS